MPPDDRSRVNSDAPPSAARDIRDLDRRVAALDKAVEVHHTEILGKLANGYETFERMRGEDTKLATEISRINENLRKKDEAEVRSKRVSIGTWIAIASFAIAIGGNLVGIVRAANKYVDREEVQKLIDRSGETERDLRDENASLQGRVIRLETRLEQVDAARAQLATLFESVLSVARVNNQKPKGQR